ncbi:MAG: HDOD domain-containing protein [Verrucomicrobiota bacterium]
MSNLDESAEPVSYEASMPLEKILAHLPSNANNRLHRDKMAEALFGDSKIPRAAFTDHKLMQLIMDPNTELESLAECIKMDPGLNLKIVRMSRTALYTRGEETRSFEDAFYRIGLKEIRKIVYADTVASSFRNFTIEVNWMDFWRRAVLKAQLTEKLLKAALGNKNFGFISGILNDTGSLLIMEYLPEQYAEIAGLIDSGHAKDLAEKSVLHFTHAHVAGVLCLKWRFPYDVAMGIYYHHSDLSRVDDVINVELYARAGLSAEHLADLSLRVIDEGLDIDELDTYYAGNEWAELTDLIEDKEVLMGIDLEKEIESATNMANILTTG